MCVRKAVDLRGLECIERVTFALISVSGKAYSILLAEQYTMRFILIVFLALLAQGCSNPSLVRDLKKRNVTYLNTTHIVVRGSESDGCPGVIVEDGADYVIQEIWDKIYQSRPYPRFAFSSWRTLELYTYYDFNEPAVTLMVNETNETHIKGTSPKDGYRCPGLEQYLINMLIRELQTKTQQDPRDGVSAAPDPLGCCSETRNM